MPRKTATETTTDTTTEKKEFPYTPFVDADTLPKPKVDKSGNFMSYAEPHFAYRRTTGTDVEFLAIYRKPKGIVTKLCRKLKVRSGKNSDDAFFRKMKDNNIPEMD